MSVRVSVEVPAAPLSEEEIARAVALALEYGGRPDLRVDVILVDDATLAELHGRFLGDPSPTDVMAFDLSDEQPFPGEGESAEAEIYASVDRAHSVAEEREEDPAGELRLYVVHGALHLCGFDDHTPQERVRMRDAEAAVLARLGASRSA